jgi:hypothetical protein
MYKLNFLLDVYMKNKCTKVDFVLSDSNYSLTRLGRSSDGSAA